MKKFIAFLVFMALVAPVNAQMGSHLKEEFHDQEAYGIYMVDKLSGLRSALLKEDARVICFQSFNEELDEERQTELLEWVREGHSVWFYDARLAPKFGMKPAFFPEEAFKNKPEKGVLGGKKRDGRATTVVSLGAHAVQTGVGQVTVFLPLLESTEDEDDKELTFGGIEVAGDTQALLQFTLDSPALVACRREGRGLIVFKSLLWNEPLSGDRFQMNLLEYSAGYEVPGPAGVGKVGNPPGPEAEYVEGNPAEPLVAAEGERAIQVVSQPGDETPVERPQGTGPWILELKNGTTLSGEFEVDLVEFETGSSSLKLKPDEVESVVFGSAVQLDKIVTARGQEKSGLLLTAPIRFRTKDGVEEFDKDDIVKLSRAQGALEE